MSSVFAPLEDTMDDATASVPKCVAMHGRIELIVGPMFCGKTTELELRMRRHMHARKRVLLVKYAGDTRYDAALVVTHDQRTAEAHAIVDKLADVVVPDGTDVILVDEAQFMPDAAAACSAWADAGHIVIVAALDGDFRRQPFPVTAALIPLAERVDKRAAVCMRCGEDAHFTYRKGMAGAVELIGGADIYEPRCRACWP